MTPSVDLTPQDAERLRQILDAYQAKNPQTIKEFDLAKPPVPPYRHKEYPLVMRNHETGKEIHVMSEREEREAGEEGFIRDALPPSDISDLPPIELSAEEAAQLAEMEPARAAQSHEAKPKAKRGPKPKATKAE